MLVFNIVKENVLKYQTDYIQHNVLQICFMRG